MITWIDWSIWTIYLAVIFTVLWFYRQSKTNNDLYKWFLKGFAIKVFGGVAFALVSIYYYGGDTLLYYRGSSILTDVFFEQPSLYFDLLFTPNNLPAEYTDIAHQISYSRTAEEWFMVRLLSFLNIISFNSYIVMTLFMSTIAFWGGWLLFKVFDDILPKYQKINFVIVFLMPTVLFWGTGILKDTLTLALFNYLIYTLYYIFEKKRFSIIKLALILLSSIVIYKLKSYIILAFISSFIYLLYLYFSNGINSPLIKKILAPIIILFFGVFGIYSIINLSESTVYNVNNIQQQVTGFHTWHTTTGGSSYNLGKVELTPFGVIKKIPSALNVTFFRPYLWEARNLTSLIGALESAFILFLFLITLFKTKVKFFSFLKSNIFLLGLSLFILIFGFAIGFTSYNFGALARYKMPIYPIFVFVLVYVFKKVKS